MKLIFDSNVFDDIVSGKLKLEVIENLNAEIFLTHIQIDELNRCSDSEKRARLFLMLIELRPTKIPTESFVIGTSRIGSAKIGDGKLIEKLRKGNRKKTNDAIIGETAIKNYLTLITNDITFRNTVIQLGGSAKTVHELLAE
ncbi:MAG: hypothetical protein RIG68_19090 [Imperialibacter sp.]|uniref:hypothetical protein n=1 Tax=Imperialibacter sp. TaxID=2038411 RepID=UPI0032EABEB0